MTRNRSAHGFRDPLRCPSCGSHYTQTLSSAYLHFPRDFEPLDKPDVLPDLMPPPQRKSAVILPLTLGALSFAYVYVFSYIFADEVEFLRTVESKFLNYLLLGASLLVALIVSLPMRRRATRWNRQELPGLLEKWHSTAICRRCSSQFEMTDPGRDRR